MISEVARQREIDWWVQAVGLLDDRRRAALIDVARRTAARRVAGRWAEFGVWAGGTALLLARELERAGSEEVMQLFDSWDEFPLSIAHIDGFFGRYVIRGPALALDALERKFGAPEPSPASVNALFRDHGFKCAMFPGYFKDTLRFAVGPFAFVHLDADVFVSTRECLLHLLPRMSPGGVLVCDDYGRAWCRRFPGVKAAIDEVLEQARTWRVVALDGGGDDSVLLERIDPEFRAPAGG